MNLAQLPAEKLKQALYHFRAAILARAQQWDHEREIELLLDREVEIEIEDYASGVEGDTGAMTPDDITFVDYEDLLIAIPDEEE